MSQIQVHLKIILYVISENTHGPVHWPGYSQVAPASTFRAEEREGKWRYTDSNQILKRRKGVYAYDFIIIMKNPNASEPSLHWILFRDQNPDWALSAVIIRKEAL